MFPYKGNVFYYKKTNKTNIKNLHVANKSVYLCIKNL